MDLGFSTTTVTADTLVNGSSIPLVTRAVTVKSGEGVLTRGTLVVAETLNSLTTKHIVYANGDIFGETGTGIPSNHLPVILAEDIDATSADVKTYGYIQGQFDLSTIETAIGTTINATHQLELQFYNIFLGSITT